MATTLDEKLKTAQVTTSGTETAASPAYTGVNAASGYKPGQSVTQAQDYLQQVNGSKPGAYNSNYTQQLSSLYDQIMNRPKFSYDLNGDALYNQYKQQYQTAGKQAMMDTMGQASALTGGYGSSYATTAGNQAYQGYLQKLNELVPTLQQNAYQQYQDAGTQLQNQYALAQSADNTDYGRYQDTLSQWNSDRTFAQGAYDSAYGKDYAGYQDAVSQQQYAQGQAYTSVMAMLQAGSMPSSEMLAQAGLSVADAQAYYNALHPVVAVGGGGGGGGSSKATASSKTNSTLNGLSYQEQSLIDNVDKVSQYAAQKGLPALSTVGSTGASTSGGLANNKLTQTMFANMLKKTGVK